MFLFTMQLPAQPVIHQSSLPQPGDTFAYIIDKLPALSFDYNQTNTVWNFAALQSDSVKYASYGITSQLPFASNFPNSNLYTYGPGFLYGGLGGGAPYPNNFGHMMFSSNTNGFYTIGFRSDFGFGMTNVLVQPNELLMKVPFTYGDSIFHSSTWEIVYNAIPTDYDTIYKRYTFKYLKATGYGTLITPYGTFSDALAVKEYTRYYDTIEVKYGSFTITKIFAQADTILNVHVWSENKRNNLLTASYNPHTLQCNSIEYMNYEHLNQIPENPVQPIAHLFPNPIRQNELCFINFYAKEAYIYNTEGKKISHILIHGSSFIFPNLPNGNYYLQFINNQGIVFKSPIIMVNGNN